MASDYRVAIGHGVALASLSPIVPQCRSEGVKTTQRTYGTTGQVHEQSPYIELEWNVAETDAEYLAIITQFGLANALTGLVTIYVPNHNFVYMRYNGMAVRPQVGTDVRRNNYFVRDVTIVVKNLVAMSQDGVAAMTLGAETLAATGTVV